MTNLTIQVQNQKDLEVLIPLLERLNIQYVSFSGKEPSENGLEEHFQVIEETRLESSSFGDPIEWQREQREDRQLPLRDE